MLVPAAKLPEVEAIAKRVAAAVITGDPASEKTNLGPLVSKVHEPLSGHSMRGSGDIHAWGDANLYAWRSKQDATVTVVKLEHRNSPPQPLVMLRRVTSTTSSGGSTAYLDKS